MQLETAFKSEAGWAAPTLQETIWYFIGGEEARVTVLLIYVHISRLREVYARNAHGPRYVLD